jgi:hypothetical protein
MRLAEPYAQQKPAADISFQEVFRRYRGLDGEVWPQKEHAEFPIEDGLAAIEHWSLVNQYVRKLASANECDVIMLARLGPRLDSVQQLGWSFAGFDVGYFESEWSHFSVILCEVIFGVNSELRSFCSRLNEHLLLSTLEDARALLTERSRLVRLGRDLEEEPPQMETLAVLLREAV